MNRFIFFLPLFLLKLIGWSYSLSPGVLRVFYGKCLGFFLRFFGFRSQVIKKNIEIIFPGDTQSEIKFRENLYKNSYSHLGTLFLELSMLFGGFKFFMKKNVKLVGLHHWKKAHEKNNGVLMLSSHVGNWEIISAACVAEGIPGLMITKHLKPEALHKAIEKGRLSCNVPATYEPKTMKDILSWIKQKKTLGCILDQYTGPPVGIRVPFFGVPVGTMTAFTYLVKKYKLQVCPTTSYRSADGSWTVEISEAIDWISDPHPEREIAINTAHYVKFVEEQIRAHPEQWLWSHRRFKGDLSPLRENEWNEGRVKK